MELSSARVLDSQKELQTLSKEIGSLLGIPLPQKTLMYESDATPVLKAVRAYRDFLVEAVIEKQIDPADDINMLQAFLNRLSLRLPFELEQYIEPGDIIEIYGEDFIQIYRNKTFFDFCSYDIHTVLSQPFDVLFRRDSAISERLVAKAVGCMTKGKGIEPIGVEPHVMQEHFARNSKMFMIEQKWCAPLISKVSGSVLGIFGSQRAHHHGESNVTGIGFIPTSH